MPSGLDGFTRLCINRRFRQSIRQHTKILPSCCPWFKNELTLQSDVVRTFAVFFYAFVIVPERRS